MEGNDRGGEGKGAMVRQCNAILHCALIPPLAHLLADPY